MLLWKYASEDENQRDLTLKEKTYLDRNYAEFTDDDVKAVRNTHGILGAIGGSTLGAMGGTLASKRNIAPLAGAGVGGLIGGLTGIKTGNHFGRKNQEVTNAARAEELSLLAGVTPEEANQYIQDIEEQARHERELALQEERLELERENTLYNRLNANRS